jgi:hypothetical protein
MFARTTVPMYVIDNNYTLFMVHLNVCYLIIRSPNNIILPLIENKFR